MKFPPQPEAQVEVNIHFGDLGLASDTCKGGPAKYRGGPAKSRVGPAKCGVGPAKNRVATPSVGVVKPKVISQV